MDFIDSTPIAALTVADLKRLLASLDSKNEQTLQTPSGHLVYGIRGIEKLFGVSHKTAQYYKDHVICEAVMQNGRKIVVDADRALELFNQRETQKRF